MKFQDAGGHTSMRMRDLPISRFLDGREVTSTTHLGHTLPA